MKTKHEKAHFQQSRLSLNSFVEHWAKAQIDVPTQTVTRYDEVAKLLITVGGFLQAIFVAVYTSLVEKQNVPVSTWQAMMLRISFCSLTGFFFCAVLVCVWQPMRQAQDILKLQPDADVTPLVKKWCKNIGRVIIWKKFWLILAAIFYSISFLIMIYLLLPLT